MLNKLDQLYLRSNDTNEIYMQTYMGNNVIQNFPKQKLSFNIIEPISYCYFQILLLKTWRNVFSLLTIQPDLVKEYGDVVVKKCEEMGFKNI